MATSSTIYRANCIKLALYLSITKNKNRHLETFFFIEFSGKITDNHNFTSETKTYFYELVLASFANFERLMQRDEIPENLE